MAFPSTPIPGPKPLDEYDLAHDEPTTPGGDPRGWWKSGEFRDRAARPFVPASHDQFVQTLSAPCQVHDVGPGEVCFGSECGPPRSNRMVCAQRAYAIGLVNIVFDLAGKVR